MGKSSKKILSVFLSLMLAFGGVGFAPTTAYAADNVPYLDENGVPQTADGVNEITSGNEQYLNSGWYIVNGNVNCTKLNCGPDVKIILADNCTLTANGDINYPGIKVKEGNTLEIYAQSTDEATMGKIVAAGGIGGAGIGGDGGGDRNCGTININGGNITATGGYCAAGIGGGGTGTPGQGGTITIGKNAVVSVKAGIEGNAIGGGCNSISYAVSYYATVINSGRLTIVSGSTLKMNGGVIITNTATGVIVNNGTIDNGLGTFTNEGTIVNNGTINNTGNITGNPALTGITWESLAANGTANVADTTELTLTFSAEPTTLDESHIAVTGATKGALTGSGDTRTLAISNITVDEGENVTVTITNPAISPSSKSVVIHRRYAPTITTAILPSGKVGTYYSQALTATGIMPITWSLDGGTTLPDGLDLSAEGVISGSPTTAGTFDFTVKASNGSGNDTQALSIVIDADAPIVTPTATPGVTSANPIDLDLNGVKTAYISVNLGQSGGVWADKANIDVTGSAVTVSPGTLTTDGNVTVTAVSVGTATISVAFSGGNVTDTTYDEDITVNVTDSYVPPVQTTHTITATAGAGGSISPSGSVDVSDGGSLSFTITANSGYHISGVTVDGVNQGAVGSYTFTNVTGDHTIHAAFAANTTGRSSGGSSGSGSSGKRNSTTSAATPTPVTWQEALGAFNKALADLAPGQTTVTVRFINRASLPLDVLKALADAATKAGVTATIHADTVSNGAVQTRLYIDPAKATKGISLTASADSPDAVNTADRFRSRFKNRLAVVATEQQDDFGMAVNIAVKVDSAEFDIKNLYFYSYDKGTNTYRRIEKPAYWIDKNGYLHFTTEYAGDIIISEGQLERK